MGHQKILKNIQQLMKILTGQAASAFPLKATIFFSRVSRMICTTEVFLWKKYFSKHKTQTAVAALSNKF